MESQRQLDSDRIEKAILYLQENYKGQPSLDEVAQHVNLSPFHFQRLFKDWAGVSPKKFLQYISINHAKQILKETKVTLFETALETGLSGTGRLHDLFIQIEGMTPGEYKNGGSNLTINYSFAETPFGQILIASTPKGICHLGFLDQETDQLQELEQQFPNATYCQQVDLTQQNALFIFNQDWNQLDKIKLHLKGTPFQLKVWEALLKIPFGQLTTYHTIAQYMDKPTASRAVGNAIGRNPIAYLIPCHRIIRTTGFFGGYKWGVPRKTAMIGWEAAHTTD